MKISVNTEQKGLLTVFKSYEAIIVRNLIKTRTTTSRDAYHWVAEGEHKRSRASVIFFLNRLRDDYEIVDVDTETTKGGWKGVYTLKKRFKNEYDVLTYIKNIIGQKLTDELLELKKSETM